jgi:serine/threonine protein kinase
MNGERWRQVDKVFHDLLEQAPEERESFLKRVCADDPALKKEVEDLVCAYQRSGSFLDSPAPVPGPASWIGRTLGSYEFKALLGSGGMGEVYRARDSKLKRDVAIKVLPPDFVCDPERVARFQREAEILASVNHPHVGAIYGVEDIGESRLLVLELVEGETLADRLARGPVPIPQALPIAVQIAEALEAAHEKGIVHRDLKPANIKITADDRVKVLDFGLAKIREHEVSLPKLPNSITAPGLILGTAAYMSPEQAQGKEADRTSDVWAFGCVLYEILTGHQAFQGETVSEIVAAVLKGEPDWGRLSKDTPELIRRLLRRCLQKERKLRLHDMADARLEIEEAQHAAPAAEGVPLSGSRRHERFAWISAVVFVAVVAAVLTSRISRPQSLLRETRLEIAAPTTLVGTSAISPDGRNILFSVNSEERSPLYLRSLDSGVTRQLAGTEKTWAPFWSPDGKRLGFFTFGEHKLSTIDLESGSVQKLCEASTGNGTFGTWGPDGTILFSASLEDGDRIFRVSSNGGEPASVIAGLSPRFLPDGRHFLYYLQKSGGVYLGDLEGSPAQHILDADSAAGYASGHVLFLRQRELLAQSFDLARLKLVGNPFLVANRVGAFAASAAGSILYDRASDGRFQFVRFDRSGKEIGPVGDLYPKGDATSLSPDGRRIASFRQDNIWLLDVARGVFTKFAQGVWPIWSSDGTRIAFIDNRRGFGVRVRSADGGGGEEYLWPLMYPGTPTDWSPDGRFLLFNSFNAEAAKGNDLWALPLDADGKRDGAPVPVVVTDTAIERNGQFSPNQKWIAYQSKESGRYEIYIQRFPGSGGHIQLSANGGVQPRWRRDGKEVFYVSPDSRLMVVRIQETPRGVEPGSPVALFTIPRLRLVEQSYGFEYAPFPDGQQFVMNLTQPTTEPLTLIMNWKGKPQ